MFANRQAGLLLVAIGASILTVYDWLGKFILGADKSPEALAFADSPYVFVCYTISICACLIVGAVKIEQIIVARKTAPTFSLLCLIAAWGGVWVSAEIGPDGIGGETMHFYWWGLALVWTFLIAGAHWLEIKKRPLAVRDWMLYAYMLAWLPALIFLTFPLWALIDIMSLDEAMITAVTLPFASVFLVAHWVIVDVLDQAKKR